MLLSLARAFFVDPVAGLFRFFAGEIEVCRQLFRRVFRPDVDQKPTEESILANATEFFRFISYWVVLQISVMEFSGTDSDPFAETTKYALLLGMYLFGFSVNYGVAFAARLWSTHDFLTNVNSIADFYNLFFWLAFMINLAFGKIDLNVGGSSDLQFQVLAASLFVLGSLFFIILRVRKIPMHGLTWLAIMVADLVFHMFNLIMLNQVVYQAI